MRVSEIMKTEGLVTCHDDLTVQQVSRMLCDHDIGCIPVVDQQQRLQGMVTDRDICCRIVARGMSLQSGVSEAMSREVHWVRPDSDIRELESVMRQFKIRRVPVADDQGRLVGFVAQADLLHHLQGSQQEHEVVEVLEEISTP